MALNLYIYQKLKLPSYETINATDLLYNNAEKQGYCQLNSIEQEKPQNETAQIEIDTHIVFEACFFIKNFQTPHEDVKS